jgi:hypothetical protein
LTLSCISTSVRHSQTTSSAGDGDDGEVRHRLPGSEKRMDGDGVAGGEAPREVELGVVAAEGELVRGVERGVAVHQAHRLALGEDDADGVGALGDDEDVPAERAVHRA